MSILEGDLAQEIADALTGADVPYEIVIPRTTYSEPPPDWPTWEPWEGDPVTVEHRMQGFIDSYSELLQASTLISEGDVKIIILKPTIPSGLTIELVDLVQAKGQTFTILNISEDPAGATVELRVAR